MLVNAYITYKRYVESKGMNAMSHYDFCMKVVLTKICPIKYGSTNYSCILLSNKATTEPYLKQVDQTLQVLPQHPAALPPLRGPPPAPHPTRNRNTTHK